MTITLLYLPLRVCSYRLDHIAHKTYSPLKYLVFHHLSLAILTNHKTEFRSTSHSLKDHLFFLHSPLPFPTRCMSVTDVSLRIYRGIPIECKPPQIGFVRTIAPGIVALGSSRKNPTSLRSSCQHRLRARKVFCRATRCSTSFLARSKCASLTGNFSRLTSSRSCTPPRPHHITSLSHELLNFRTSKRLYFFSRNSRSQILVSAPRSSMPYAPRDSR
jgi:hypothetical protein